MTRSYQDLIRRKTAEHGARFSAGQLDSRFVRYYESGERIKVEAHGETFTGTVGATTGWWPTFLLMRTSRSMGSSITLGAAYQIVAVKRGRTYQEAR